MLRLAPQRSFEAKHDDDGQSFLGRSYFFGKADELVLCWDWYHDKFCVWDRQFGVLLHKYDYWYRGGTLGSLDVNRAASAFTFATGSFSGDIVIYRTSEAEESEAAANPPVEVTENADAIPIPEENANPPESEAAPESGAANETSAQAVDSLSALVEM